MFNPLHSKGTRKTLRRDSTIAEDVFWQHVRGHRFYGLKFYRQFGINTYIVDFCCPSKSIVIELDGGHHRKKFQKTEDEKRDACLKECGFQIFRFWNREVIRHIDVVLERVRKAMQE